MQQQWFGSRELSNGYQWVQKTRHLFCNLHFNFWIFFGRAFVNVVFLHVLGKLFAVCTYILL